MGSAQTQPCGDQPPWGFFVFDDQFSYRLSAIGLSFHVVPESVNESALADSRKPKAEGGQPEIFFPFLPGACFLGKKVYLTPPTCPAIVPPFLHEVFRHDYWKNMGFVQSPDE